MALQTHYVELARSLPPPLLRFFARYPPSLTKNAKPSIVRNVTSETTTSNVSTVDPNAPMSEAPLPSQTPESPFKSTKHSKTGKWHDPVYSLRRQADLVKLARTNGVEELLPFTVKGTAQKTKKRESSGLRVRGTGVGQRVKGKAWERTMKTRLKSREQAMLDMPQMIQTWKEVGFFYISENFD